MGESGQAILTPARAERLPQSRIGSPGQWMRRAVASLARVLKHRKGAIDACNHLVFSENFEKVVKTRSHIAAGYREPSWMNDRSNFYTQSHGGVFQCRFNLGGIELVQRT